MYFKRLKTSFARWGVEWERENSLNVASSNEAMPWIIGGGSRGDENIFVSETTTSSAKSIPLILKRREEYRDIILSSELKYIDAIQTAIQTASQNVLIKFYAPGRKDHWTLVWPCTRKDKSIGRVSRCHDHWIFIKLPQVCMTFEHCCATSVWILQTNRPYSMKVL